MHEIEILTESSDPHAIKAAVDWAKAHDLRVEMHQARRLEAKLSEVDVVVFSDHPEICHVCAKPTGDAYARRTGDYTGAGNRECDGGCERLVCGRCGTWDYCSEEGPSVSCDEPDCEARKLALESTS